MVFISHLTLPIHTYITRPQFYYPSPAKGKFTNQYVNRK